MSLTVGNIISAALKAVARTSSNYGVVFVGDTYTQLVELSSGTPLLKDNGKYVITTILNGFSYTLQPGSVAIDSSLIS